jgi:hypothetical protein
MTDTSVPQYVRPMVRGEEVTIVGPNPEGYIGLGHKNGDILVSYPDGETGCVTAADIREGAE